VFRFSVLSGPSPDELGKEQNISELLIGKLAKS
jgi:hypothetical protein